ncbi:MAG: tRNA epoxyqueuosine(34) reductase QueG [Phycisphaerales bacterium]|nr:MAG: tRNA epoxyqueuosine(34) reductase QueG [Phycisphaerales bacterium]
MSLTDQIKHRAIELGFDLVGVTDASPLAAGHSQRLAGWLKAGYAGEMRYMHRNFEKRIHPALLLEDAKSVIVVALNYKRPELRRPLPRKPPTGRVAVYARYEDYHRFINHRLRKLADFICSVVRERPRFKICVDSVPLAERALAARAGLGFIGRNHMLIHPDLGPQILLGEIVSTMPLEPDEPAGGDCAGCTKCLDACPTGAIGSDGRFDARRCISYLTIEHRELIAPPAAETIGDRLFGCDECVLACPYQQKAPPCRNGQFRFYPDRAELDLREILALTAESFQSRFGDSPIKRPGLERLKRNARICLANKAAPQQ